MTRLLQVSLLFAILVSPLPPASAQTPVVSAAERQEEVTLWRKLGVTVPDGGFIKEKPYPPPLTRNSYLVPSSWHFVVPPSQIDTAALRKDLEVLGKIVETAYGGFARARKRGVDWRRFFTDWDSFLKSSGKELPLRQAFEPWLRLSDKHLDNHSGPWPLAMAKSSDTLILDNAPLKPCSLLKFKDGSISRLNKEDAAQQPKPSKLLQEDGSIVNDWVLTYPRTDVAATAVMCGARWIAGRGSADAGLENPKERKKWVLRFSGLQEDTPSFTTISSEVAYYRAPTGSEAHMARAANVVVPNDAAAAKTLIVDFRMNDGGGPTIGPVFDWLGIPPSKEISPFGSRHIRHSCLYEALRLGFFQFFDSRANSLRPAARDEFERLIKAVLSPLENGECSEISEDTKAKVGFADRAVSISSSQGKRLLLLVDNWCGSECELSVLQLAAIRPDTLILGRATAGILEYLQPGYFVLPYTRVPFRIALGVSDVYGDNRAFDGHGIDVDVVVPDKTLSRDNLLSFLARLEESSRKIMAKRTFRVPLPFACLLP